MPAPLLLLVLLLAVEASLASVTEDSSDSAQWIPPSRRKVWRRYTVVSDSDNWEGGAVPCSGDVIEFPRNMLGGAATLQSRDRPREPVRFRGVKLPFQGTIILPKDGGLVVGGDDFRTSACPGRSVRWRAVAAKPAWLDPANWDIAGVLPQDMEAVPHLQRIPCGQDVADFPSNAFVMTPPDIGSLVGLGLIEGEVIRSSIGFFLSAPGMMWRGARYRLQFQARALPEIATLDEQCGLAPGGYSGEAAEAAAADLRHAVCSLVTCPEPACAHPVLPHLHCCYICGAVLELRPPGSASSLSSALEDVRRAVLSEAVRYDARFGARPATFVGAVPSPQGDPTFVQVVIVGRDAEDLAAAILTRLANEPGVAGLTASMLQSGAAMAPATAASVVGMLLGSLCLALLAVVLLVYFQDRSLPISARLADFLGEKQSSFLFARFENAPGAEDNGIVVNVVGKQPAPGVRSARGSWSARSFRNPLFGEEHAGEDGPLPQSTARGVTHENPLFSELQRRVGSEDQDDNGGLVLLEEPAPAAAEPAAVEPAAAAQQSERESAAAARAPLVDVTL